ERESISAWIENSAQAPNGHVEKRLPKREPEINPVQKNCADETELERANLNRAAEGTKPAPIPQPIHCPRNEPGRDPGADDQGQRVPVKRGGEVEPGARLETAHGAAKRTRDAGESFQKAKWQRKRPRQRDASARQQQQHSRKGPRR